MPIQLLVILITGVLGIDKNRHIAGWLRRISGKVTSQSYPKWRFELLGKSPDKLPERCVIVCNHISNADVAAVTTMFPFTAKFVAKGELRFIPFMGQMMMLAGDIFIKYRDDALRTDGTRAMNKEEVHNKMKKYVSEGTPVVLFPEGWRSRNGKLLFFKDGAFSVAKETNAAIIPVAILGTDSLWPMGYDAPCAGRAFMKIGAPINAGEVQSKDIEELKKMTQQSIIDLKCEIEEEVQSRDKKL